MFKIVMGVILLVIGLITLIHFSVDEKVDYVKVETMKTSTKIIGSTIATIIIVCSILLFIF